MISHLTVTHFKSLVHLDLRACRVRDEAPAIDVYRLAPSAVWSWVRSSTSAFQAPQSAQRPNHFGDWAPHS
jgi:hypothetical protein